MQTEEKKNKFKDDFLLYLFLGTLAIGFLGLIVYVIYSVFIS